MSFSTTDTIVAIATPPGQGGVGIVRLSGPQAWDIVGQLFVRRARGPLRPQRLYYGRIIAPATGDILDDGLVACMRGPHSYTGEDVAEINAHGAPVILQRIVAAALALGARAAEPGEMTLRAFLHGRIDLAQAEAVADLIAAQSDAAARQARGQLDGRLSVKIQAARAEILHALAPIAASIDFPEDEVPSPDRDDLAKRIAAAAGVATDLLASAAQGRIVREGVRCAIVGRPNVGKSSVLNRLLGTDRAIVTPIAGTTRDTIEATTSIGGVAFHLIDTAGIAATDDPIERLGIDRSRAALTEADVALLVVDRSVPLTDADHAILDEAWALGFGAARGLVIALNKSDLPPALDDAGYAALADTSDPTCRIATSTLTGAGMAELEAALLAAALGGPLTEGAALVARARHRDALRAAVASLAAAQATLADGLPLDLVAEDLHDALHALGLITGESVTDDLLGAIFSEFCIGK
jgi:tRNA modification GTPase